MFWGYAVSAVEERALGEASRGRERSCSSEKGVRATGEACSTIQVRRVQLSLPPPEQVSSSDQTTRT